MSDLRIYNDLMDSKRLIALVPRGVRVSGQAPTDAPLDAGVGDFAFIGGKNFTLVPQRMRYS